MPVIRTPEDQRQETGLTKSILAGIGSGVFKIFEGAATLGATLLDLGIDKNRAEAVENFLMISILLMRQPRQQLLVELQN